MNIGLTAREREVLLLLGSGWKAAEVGEMLGLSPKTVDSHRARGYAKLGIASRRELMEWLGLACNRCIHAAHPFRVCGTGTGTGTGCECEAA